MAYNKTLPNADSIEVKPYYKKSNQQFLLLNVAVASIGDGTVNAKIGDCDSYKDYPKQQIFEYINACCYSDTND